MSRFFSTTARSFVRWLGYPRENLPEIFKNAAEHYAENGAKKVQHLNSLPAPLPIHPLGTASPYLGREEDSEISC